MFYFLKFNDMKRITITAFVFLVILSCQAQEKKDDFSMFLAGVNIFADLNKTGDDNKSYAISTIPQIGYYLNSKTVIGVTAGLHYYENYPFRYFFAEGGSQFYVGAIINGKIFHVGTFIRKLYNANKSGRLKYFVDLSISASYSEDDLFWRTGGISWGGRVKMNEYKSEVNTGLSFMIRKNINAEIRLISLALKKLYMKGHDSDKTDSTIFEINYNFLSPNLGFTFNF